MTAAERAAERPGRQEESPSAFHAVVFYEDRAAGQLARRALDMITGQLDLAQQEVFLALWRLDVAHLDEFRDEVAADLARADLIIVAAANVSSVKESLRKIRLPHGETERFGRTILLLDLEERLVYDATFDGLHPSACRSLGPDSGAGWTVRSCA